MMKQLFLLILLMFASCTTSNEDIEEALRQANKPVPEQAVTPSKIEKTEDNYSYKTQGSTKIRVEETFDIGNYIVMPVYTYTDMYTNKNVVFNFLDAGHIKIEVSDETFPFRTSVTYQIEGSWDYDIIEGMRVFGNRVSHTAEDKEYNIVIKYDPERKEVKEIHLGDVVFYSSAPRKPEYKAERMLDSSTYVVKRGDFVRSIAEKFGLSLEEFYQLNPNVRDRENHVVHPGEAVKVK